MNRSYISFTIGAVAGAVVGYFVAKRRYEPAIQELTDEIDSMVAESHGKEKKEEGEPDKNEPEHHVPEKKDVHEYVQKLKESGYISKEEKKVAVDKPYVINPMEFGEFEDYETITLTLYSDGVLTDDIDEPIDDVDEIVGLESLDHFGEFEEDSVYVRNDAKRCDYEILRDLGKYSDKKKKRAH